MESHPLYNKVYAIFDGPVREGNELTIKFGDVIEVIEKDNDEWWKGRMLKTRKVGYFRRNCVQEFTKEIAEGKWTTKGRVIEKYRKEQDKELNLRVGDEIYVKTANDADDWWTGYSNGAIGLFPSLYVKVVERSSAPLVDSGPYTYLHETTPDESDKENETLKKTNEDNEIENPKEHEDAIHVAISGHFGLIQQVMENMKKFYEEQVSQEKSKVEGFQQKIKHMQSIMESKDQYIKNLELLLKEKDSQISKLKEEVEDPKKHTEKPPNKQPISRPTTPTGQPKSRPTTPVLQSKPEAVEHITFHKVKDFWTSQQQQPPKS